MKVSTSTVCSQKLGEKNGFRIGENWSSTRCYNIIKLLRTPAKHLSTIYGYVMTYNIKCPYLWSLSRSCCTGGARGGADGVRWWAAGGDGKQRRRLLRRRPRGESAGCCCCWTWATRAASGSRARRWPAVETCRTWVWTCSRTHLAGRRRRSWRGGRPWLAATGRSRCCRRAYRNSSTSGCITHRKRVGQN